MAMVLKTKSSKVNTKGWTLYAHLGCIVAWMDIEGFVFDERNYESLEEFFKDYPDLASDIDYCGDKTICLKVDINTGKVLNWPKGVSRDFNNIKLVDTGTYQIRNERNEIIAGYKGYVPECLQVDENGFGDYLQFWINEDGYIDDWEFNQEYFDEFIKKE